MLECRTPGLGKDGCSWPVDTHPQRTRSYTKAKLWRFPWQKNPTIATSSSFRERPNPRATEVSNSACVPAICAMAWIVCRTTRNHSWKTSGSRGSSSCDKKKWSISNPSKAAFTKALAEVSGLGG